MATLEQVLSDACTLPDEEKRKLRDELERELQGGAKPYSTHEEERAWIEAHRDESMGQGIALEGDGHEEVRVLSELDGRRERWDFVINNKNYGKLVGSYYPINEEGSIAWLYDVVTQTKKGKNVIDLNIVMGCYEELLEVMKKKIPQNLHDAMVGMLMESVLETKRKLNGVKFTLYGLEVRDEWSEIRDYHSRASGERMGARQGKTARPLDFLSEAYSAYRKVKIEETEQEEQKLKSRLYKYKNSPVPVRVAYATGNLSQESLAEAMEKSVNGLARQTKNNGFTHAKLMKQLVVWWEQECVDKNREDTLKWWREREKIKARHTLKKLTF